MCPTVLVLGCCGTHCNIIGCLILNLDVANILVLGLAAAVCDHI